MKMPADWRLSTSTCIHLEDLNNDCLREIFQHLDLTAQFSITKSSKQLFNIILYDIWYSTTRRDSNTFDLSNDQSMAMQSINFQIDFLELIFKNFNRIKGISSEIFQRFIKKSSFNEFPQIVALSLYNHYRSKAEPKCLDMNTFCKFPLLRDLQLENIPIDFRAKNNFPHLESLHLKNISALNDLEGEFLKEELSSNLKKFSLESSPSVNISLRNIANISKCVQLRELTLSFHFLYDPGVLNCILNLPLLHILTLTSADTFYFSSQDHIILCAVLKIFFKNISKAITGLQLNGIPEKAFYLGPYLQNVISLNWIVKKSFHRKLDGTVEWKSDLQQVITSFYEFVMQNNKLEYLCVGDNIFHKKRTLNEDHFLEKLHESRSLKGFKRLNIVNNYKQFKANYKLYDLAEGSVRFYIETRQKCL